MERHQIASCRLSSVWGIFGFRHPTQLLLISLLLLSCTGCTSWRDYVANGFKVGPSYCTPNASVNDEWIDMKDPKIGGGAMENAAWWQSFNDPVLNSLITSACQQNLSLREAGYRIQEARAQRNIVAGKLFPQDQAVSGNYSRNQFSENGPSSLTPNMIFSDWQLGGNLAWELDFWGQFRRALESANATLDASIDSYDQVLVLLLGEVAQSYSNVRIAEQRLTYARQNVEIQRGSLGIAEDRLRQGTTTRLDVTQGVSNLEQTEANIRPLEAARRTAINQLCILMGEPPRDLDQWLADHQGIPKAPRQLAIGIPAELLRRRPDIRKAERDVAAQSAQIGVATAELYPHFAIGGTIYLDSMDAKNLFNANSIAGSVGPEFRWNVLNYGRLLNNIRYQEARFRELATAYQNIVLQANAEAENAIINFLKAQQQVESLARSAQASQESVDLVMKQYREGIVDFNRVFNVQQSLTQQQDQLAVAEGTVAQYMIQLYRSLGGGWQVRLDNPDFTSTAAPPAPAPTTKPTDAPVPLPPPQSAPMPPTADEKT